jgi:3',5'-cyclic AMP phosphodiesterase CpdA
MNFSVLHISDLHRDLSDEVANEWLLDSLARDFDQFEEQTPKIMRPSLCIVSGDLVHGVSPNANNADNELKRQYAQAEEFLVGLADRFFEGDRERVIILPGNHDVCLNE